MKKKRIRYSELSPVPREEQKRRISTPVDLARAIAAERAAEAAMAAAAAARDAHASAGDESVPASASVAQSVDQPRVARSELLLFRVAHERFAVPLTDVEEAVDRAVVHFVPEMPPSMLGVVSLRGSLVCVFSPNLALGLPATEQHTVLIFHQGPTRVGVLVDDVEDAVTVDPSELRNPPMAERSEMVHAVARVGDELLSVVDPQRLISACQRGTFAEAT